MFESQFFNNQDINKEIPTENNTQNKEESNKVYIYQLVPILIMDCNLDINYVLNEMHYSEIDSYIKYRDDKNYYLAASFYLAVSFHKHSTSIRLKVKWKV